MSFCIKNGYKIFPIPYPSKNWYCDYAIYIQYKQNTATISKLYPRIKSYELEKSVRKLYLEIYNRLTNK